MLDELLLLRLLAAAPVEVGETLSKITRDLRPLAADGAGASHWEEMFAGSVDRLKAAGCIAVGSRKGARLRLTDAGGRRAREFFGVAESALPNKGQRKRTGSWPWLRDYFALPKALDARKPLNADGLRVALLRKFFLPELQLHGADDKVNAIVDQLLAKTLKTPRANPADFRAAALRRWLAGEAAAPAASAPQESRPAASLPEDLPAFACLTIETARRSETGHFGEKVFISHIWRKLLADGCAQPDELPAFKERLVQASRAGLLRLSRADLTAAHEFSDVDESETSYLHERFHYVCLD